MSILPNSTVERADVPCRVRDEAFGFVQRLKLQRRRPDLVLELGLSPKTRYEATVELIGLRLQQA